MAEDLGAKAVMVTPSKEGTPLADDRMVEYFSRVAEGINIKIVLQVSIHFIASSLRAKIDLLRLIGQDHPASTAVNMSVPLLGRLVNEIRKWRVCSSRSAQVFASLTVNGLIISNSVSQLKSPM